MKNNTVLKKTNFPDAEYLTRLESAAFLRMSLSSFDQKKDIERIQYGKSIRFSISALRRYAQEHTIGGKKNDE
jgi:hypothetical protein